MSAVVCGKRSFFEDLPTPVSKKIRCSSSTSPVSFSPLSPSPPTHSYVDRLREVFPHMEQQLLEKALEECDDDIDAAIKRLHELCLRSSVGDSCPIDELKTNVEQDTLDADGDAIPTEDSAAQSNIPAQNALPADGSEWVELFVREMMSATSLDDARARAARVMEVLEKSIAACTKAETAAFYQKENMMLKEQNAILTRGVLSQLERHKEYDGMNRELQHLKQLVSQYQEQLRTLEVSNYALKMHLKQAQQSSPIPGPFNPDVF
ncbi:hypothetical protein Nepgr_019490 [Nepenthes gracilis]|uniref:CUE domain-containing protein n=1 Tax=Nepenthes gracilis TaxID=150966 RepID=A0AAD3SVD5_NEPGR|nr:hypothetical protein Nepgr_019490 [Nepenthes gracilis]